LHSGRQPVSAVALEDSTVYGIQLRHLHGLRQRCPALDTAIYLAMSRQLGRAAEYAEMMAAVASEVRLARFLLWMSSRVAASGQSRRRILLRMGRREIASLLGLAHETVSRSFSSLADEGYISVNNREVVILDIDRLTAHASCTRGPDDGLPPSPIPTSIVSQLPPDHSAPCPCSLRP
jgi:CRP/FNR family transcriptional regulator